MLTPKTLAIGTAVGLLAIGVWAFRQLYYEHAFMTHSEISEKRMYLEQTFGLSFPPDSTFHFLNTWGGLRDEGEMLKFSAPSNQIDVMIMLFQAEEIARINQPITWKLEKYPEWDLPFVHEGYSIIGRKLNRPGTVTVVITPSSGAGTTVYMARPVGID